MLNHLKYSLDGSKYTTVSCFSAITQCVAIKTLLTLLYIMEVTAVICAKYSSLTLTIVWPISTGVISWVKMPWNERYRNLWLELGQWCRRKYVISYDVFACNILHMRGISAFFLNMFKTILKCSTRWFFVGGFCRAYSPFTQLARVSLPNIYTTITRPLRMYAIF